jgi:hypothetical protein
LRKFENKKLREILGLRRDDVTEDWKNLHNEVLHDLYFRQRNATVIK